MNIAEKLTTIAENEQKVFDAGKEAENKRHWEKFWKNLKNPEPNSNNYNLRCAFAGGGWNVETFGSIIYPSETFTVRGSTVSQYVFNYFNRGFSSGSTEQIDLSEFCRRASFKGATNLQYAFQNAVAKNITLDLSGCTNIAYAFSGDNGGYIENLTLKITSKCVTMTNAFAYMGKTQNIFFTEDSEIVKSVSFAQSSQLSDESIQSIINALGTVTSTNTITFHSTVVDKLTDEQVAQIVNKGWEIA